MDLSWALFAGIGGGVALGGAIGYFKYLGPIRSFKAKAAKMIQMINAAMADGRLDEDEIKRILAVHAELVSEAENIKPPKQSWVEELMLKVDRLIQEKKGE